MGHFNGTKVNLRTTFIDLVNDASKAMRFINQGTKFRKV